jgi:hypothetical protein
MSVERIRAKAETLFMGPKLRVRSGSPVHHGVPIFKVDMDTRDAQPLVATTAAK